MNTISNFSPEYDSKKELNVERTLIIFVQFNFLKFFIASSRVARQASTVTIFESVFPLLK